MFSHTINLSLCWYMAHISCLAIWIHSNQPCAIILDRNMWYLKITMQPKNRDRGAQKAAYFAQVSSIPQRIALKEKHDSFYPFRGALNVSMMSCYHGNVASYYISDLLYIPKYVRKRSCINHPGPSCEF